MSATASAADETTLSIARSNHSPASLRAPSLGWVKTLVASLAVAATLLTPLPAEAKQAPVLTVTTVPDASYPQEVHAATATPRTSASASTTTEADHGHGDREGAGLTVTARPAPRR